MRPLASMGIVWAVTALLSDVGIYLWQRQQYETFKPTQATVLALSYLDLTGKQRYSRTLVVELQLSTGSGVVRKNVADGDSSARPQYVAQTRPGDRVTVWVNEDASEIKLFAPDRPELFTHLGITAPTVGLIAALISAIFFGKRIVRSRK